MYETMDMVSAFCAGVCLIAGLTAGAAGRFMFSLYCLGGFAFNEFLALT